MRAARFSSGTVSCAEVPDPVPGTEDLLVEVRAAGLNGADLAQMAGRYPPPPGTREDLGGLECAGVVVGLGAGVVGFELGDEVMGLVPGAGQAELATLHQRVAIHVPTGIGWPAAGGFSEAFATAHDALFTQAGLCSGERLLINGAAGGVGVAALQLALAAGAEVVASVRDEGLRAGVAGLEPPGRQPGAGVALEVTDPAGVAEHGPYDVVLELVGAPNLAGDIAALRTGGRVAVIGLGAGARCELDLGRLMARRARVFGSSLRSRPLEEKALVMRRLERHVLPLLARDAVQVPIEATYPLTEVAAAYGRFAKGAKLGKVVLVVGS